MRGSVIVGVSKNKDITIDYQITDRSLLCKFETNGLIEDIYAFLPIRKKDIEAFEDALIEGQGYITTDDVIKYIKLFGGQIITNQEEMLIVY